jgi:hypothetical protein
MKGDHNKAAFSSTAALARARVLQRIAAKYQDDDWMKRGQTLEARAKEALKQGQADLPPTN